MSDGWDFKKAGSLALAGLLIFGLWQWAAPVRALFDDLDRGAFFALNGLLTGQGAFSRLIAEANTKIYDALCALLLAVVLLSYCLAGGKAYLPKRLADMGAVGIFVMAGEIARRELGIFEIGRDSPSLSLTPFNDLRLLYPDIHAKVIAADCFPSDHMFVTLVLAVMMWRIAGKGWGLAVFMLSPFFLLPRLFSGAHWLTDHLIGGVSLGLIVLGIALGTPVVARMAGLIEKPLSKIFARLCIQGDEGKKHV